MRKAEIAKRLAGQAGVTSAEAADQLDRVVNQILAKLRKGKTARFPGLGQFTPGPQGSFLFQPKVSKSKAKNPAGHGRK
jgi:nucleoid DNA-binding protein